MSYIGKKTKTRAEIPMSMTTKVRKSKKEYNRKENKLSIKDLRKHY